MNPLDLAYLLVAGATAPWWARKSRSGWAERFGKIAPLPLPTVSRRRVLVHAVSVGEANALRHLVPLLSDRLDVVVSASTDTGLARARELFASRCHVVRYPLDASWAVRRFLDSVKPDAVALVELELWPNFVGACRRRGIPVCVINGRLSDRSFKGYRRIRRWIGPSFASLAVSAVQDEVYANRFRAMGVAPDHVVVTGSMKWDAARVEDRVAGAEELAASLQIDRSRPLVVAGSTAEDEESLLHRSCPPGAQLLCAPRKPERFDDAADALPGCVRRSKPGSGDPASGRFLLDTIGELRAAYSLADVVVLGRSFGSLHGSDPAEPAALGKPVVIGPAYGDFRQAVEALEQAGGIVKTDRAGVPGVLARLLADPMARDSLGQNARECVRTHQGASARNAEILTSLASRAGQKSPWGDARQDLGTDFGNPEPNGKAETCHPFASSG